MEEEIILLLVALILVCLVVLAMYFIVWLQMRRVHRKRLPEPRRRPVEFQGKEERTE